jgi:hypothetical protein
MFDVFDDHLDAGKDYLSQRREGAKLEESQNEYLSRPGS